MNGMVAQIVQTTAEIAWINPDEIKGIGGKRRRTEERVVGEERRNRTLDGQGKASATAAASSSSGSDKENEAVF